jgi:hypothetical protein
MPFRAVLVLLGALLAFVGASLLSTRSAHAASHPASNTAPLCDERAASAYAAEPAPQPIESGDVTQSPESPCKAIMSGGATAPNKDDLSRTPEVPHDSSTLIPAAPMLVPAVIDSDAARAIVIDRPSDEHRQNDNPPPRPIPWRS